MDPRYAQGPNTTLTFKLILSFKGGWVIVPDHDEREIDTRCVSRRENVARSVLVHAAGGTVSAGISRLAG